MVVCEKKSARRFFLGFFDERPIANKIRVEFPFSLLVPRHFRTAHHCSLRGPMGLFRSAFTRTSIPVTTRQSIIFWVYVFASILLHSLDQFIEVWMPAFNFAYLNLTGMDVGLMRQNDILISCHPLERSIKFPSYPILIASWM